MSLITTVKTVLLSVTIENIMLSVIMLSAVVLNVVAPSG